MTYAEFLTVLEQAYEAKKKERIACDRANDFRTGRIVHEAEITFKYVLGLALELNVEDKKK